MRSSLSEEQAVDPGRRKLGFPRERRILKRSTFKRVYGEGRKKAGRHVTVFCLGRSGEPGEEGWRLGVTATRKSGKAVQRNRQRRLVREFFRLNQPWIPEGWDFVVNTRASLGQIRYCIVEDDLRGVLRRLGFKPPDEGREGENRR